MFGVTGTNPYIVLKYKNTLCIMLALHVPLVHNLWGNHEMFSWSRWFSDELRRDRILGYICE